MPTTSTASRASEAWLAALLVACSSRPPAVVTETADETTTTSSATTPGTSTTSEPTASTTTTTTTAPTPTTATGDGYCGDGQLDPGEQCDDGPENDNAGACLEQCLTAICGDGHVWAQVEECDLGDGNIGGYGGCTAGCELDVRCGDGVLQPGHEDCDAGVLNGTGAPLGDHAPCSATCRWHGRLGFVTSTKHTGALGGLDGADVRCRDLAGQARLANAGMFRAWLSDGSQSPATRFQQLGLTGAPFYMRNGRLLASDFAELASSGPRTGLAITEGGELVTEQLVWTNTTALGGVLHPEDHCDGWTSASGQRTATFGVNAVGLELGPAWETWKADRQWTVVAMDACNHMLRLYCLEDAPPAED